MNGMGLDLPLKNGLQHWTHQIAQGGSAGRGAAMTNTEVSSSFSMATQLVLSKWNPCLNFWLTIVWTYWPQPCLVTETQQSGVERVVRNVM